MLRKKRPTGILISAELHEKIARSSKRIDHEVGQVLRVRSVSPKVKPVANQAARVRHLWRAASPDVARLAGGHVSYGSSW